MLFYPISRTTIQNSRPSAGSFTKVAHTGTTRRFQNNNNNNTCFAEDALTGPEYSHFGVSRSDT